MKTRAAILESLNAPLVLDEIEMPPLACGQVLVQVRRSGICGSQLGEIAGVKGPDKYLPHLLGHEGGGVVLECGPGVTRVRPGDHVVMHWQVGPGIQAHPPKYKWNGRVVNAGWVTTFNEHAIVSENRLTAIAKEVAPEIAALMGCAVTTGLGVVINDAAVKIGQSVAVLGCGGIGLNVVQGAAMVSAEPIIAIDIHPQKLEMARRFGATHVIRSGAGDLREEVRRIVGPQGVDVFVENTGLTALIQQAYELTAAAGRTVLVGVPRFDQDITIHSLPLHFGKVLTGSAGGQTNPATDIPRYIRLYQAGKLKLDEQITHHFPLERINEALDTVRKGEAGRCMVDLSST